MIFDELGLPRDNGATDLQDSARLAGILVTFDWPAIIPIGSYVCVTVKSESTNSSVSSKSLKYMRHPKEEKYDFSRDQAICLMAGLAKKGMSFFVNKEYITGKDIFSPSQMGHITICKGEKSKWYQNLWLWLDVVYSCVFTPKSEPNQLLCMMMTHPNKRYLKFWLKFNRHWKTAITAYWCGWRNELELAAHMIKKLSEYEKQ